MFDKIYGTWSRLEDAGYAVGARVLELLCHRDKVCDTVDVLLWFHVFLNAIVLGYYCDLAVMDLSSIKRN